MDIARRRGMARAWVAVARKLGVILHRMWCDQANLPLRQGPDRSRRLTSDQKETAETRTRAFDRAAEIVQMGMMGAAIPLIVPNAATRVADVVNQIGTPRSPDPIMRRPRADSEAKRLTAGTGKCQRKDIKTISRRPQSERTIGSLFCRHPDGVLIVGTGLPCVGIIAELEAAPGRPVITANQASLWQWLRLVGVEVVPIGYGRLFNLPGSAPRVPSASEA
jgi:hypothetical protein